MKKYRVFPEKPDTYYVQSWESYWVQTRWWQKDKQKWRWVFVEGHPHCPMKFGYQNKAEEWIKNQISEEKAREQRDRELHGFQIMNPPYEYP